MVRAGAVEGEANPYFTLITRFAIDFEKTYIRWLYNALAMVEQNQSTMPPGT